MRDTTYGTSVAPRRPQRATPAHCSLLISDRQMVENERKVNVLCGRLLEWMDRGGGLPPRTRMGESGEGGREKKKKTQEVALHQYLPPSKRELKATAATEFGKVSFWEEKE